MSKHHCRARDNATPHQIAERKAFAESLARVTRLVFRVPGEKPRVEWRVWNDNHSDYVTFTTTRPELYLTAKELRRDVTYHPATDESLGVMVERKES